MGIVNEPNYPVNLTFWNKIFTINKGLIQPTNNWIISTQKISVLVLE